MTNSLAYLLCQDAKRATDYRPGMTPEDIRVVSNRMPDIRDIDAAGRIDLVRMVAQWRKMAQEGRPIRRNRCETGISRGDDT